MAREPKTLGEAIAKYMKGPEHMFPTQMSAAEHEAFKRAEIEHALGVACRMNPRTFRVEYYEVATGKIVSSHI